ncbi:protein STRICTOSIDINE SYNTHASE-LIKE 3-like [Silene latifolia]|uniref:protein STRICTOSIDINE SYNTHASE-LIKE 3-like n=1 Tax=Silene latifolia TaxID=37657 RepID=UPI003D779495
MNGRTRVLAGFLLALAVYCAVDPFKHSGISDFPDFVSYKVDLPVWSVIPTNKDPNNLLQKSEIKFLGQIHGPESIVFDPLGRGPYTGVADGRVVFWNGDHWTDFAYTSPNRSSLCDPKPSPLDYLQHEHICGRPLGLRFNKKTGELYIADAYFGLMKVGPDGGLATSLATEAGGVPLRFTNDLDIDDQGNVYFTDSSTAYQRRHFMQLVFASENSGRVLKYDPVTKETTVLMSNIQFPNGVTLSKDGSFFIFCEGTIGRLIRYWLKGEKAGTSDIFAILPGFPDNVRTNQDGDFWVALHCRRSSSNYWLATQTKLRDLLLKLPIKAKYQFMLFVGGFPHGIIVKYNPAGEILQILEDRSGKVVKAISEVEEKDGKLWIASVLMPFIAIYDLGSSFSS